MSKSAQSAINDSQRLPSDLQHAFKAAFLIWIFCELVNGTEALSGEGVALPCGGDTAANGFNVTLGLCQYFLVRASIQSQTESKAGTHAALLA